MIRCIAAIDSARGIADERGIPWQGQLPTDVAYYRDKISSGGAVIMGYGLYEELKTAYAGRANCVVTHNKAEKLRDGFTAVYDARQFLTTFSGDIWNLGGAGLFADTFDLSDELYLTLIDKDFHCTKFFPQYDDTFSLAIEGDLKSENGISFRFNVYTKNSSN